MRYHYGITFYVKKDTCKISKAGFKTKDSVHDVGSESSIFGNARCRQAILHFQASNVATICATFMTKLKKGLKHLSQHIELKNLLGENIMPVQLKVKDIMVSIDDYAVTTADKPLKEAVPELMKIYCQVETGKCTEAGHRSSLVLDAQGKLVGILDFKSILKVLIPEIAGGISGKLHALGVSIAFAEADAHDMDHAKHGFRSRVRQNAQTNARDVMLKIRGTIDADASFLDALKMIYRNKITVLPVYEGGKLVGVLRDSDLFLAAANVLSENEP